MSGTGKAMTRPLSERRAVVTGGGSGIGRATALALADHGAALVLVGRSEHALDRVAHEASSRARSVQVVVSDVSQETEVNALRERVGDDVDILINNAGIGGPVANLVDIMADDWDEVFSVNVRGMFLMCRAFLPPMIRRRGGDIINLASVTGKRPLAGRTPYAASKMAVIGLTSTLAWEVGSYGVKVNSLSPGPVAGERMRRNFVRESERTGSTYHDSEREFVSRGALQRMISEDEVAHAVVQIIGMSGLSGSDIDLSAGMVA